MDVMEKVERIKSIINGDRQKKLAYGFWTHFPLIDLDAQVLAETTYGFYKELDLDFIKTMPNGMFSVEDFGCECDYSDIPKGGNARVSKVGVENPDDWERLENLDIEQGSMGRELDSLKRLFKLINGEAPVIATVFSPMTTAHKLSGGLVLEHLRTSPEKVKAGLDVITEVTCRFARRVVEAGCAGLFLATQLCTEEMLEHSEYAQYCKPYDLAVLNAVQEQTWFNVIHVHGNCIMYDQVADYPVQGMSWHIWETPPSVEEFQAQTPERTIVGGFQRDHITYGLMDEATRDLEKMVRSTKGDRLILAPGCTIRHPCDQDRLKTLVSIIRDFERKYYG